MVKLGQSREESRPIGCACSRTLIRQADAPCDESNYHSFRGYKLPNQETNVFVLRRRKKRVNGSLTEAILKKSRESWIRYQQKVKCFTFLQVSDSKWRKTHGTALEYPILLWMVKKKDNFAAQVVMEKASECHESECKLIFICRSGTQI